MTHERIPTIWDQPLPRSTRKPQTQQARATERFLTIWSRPVARLPQGEA